MFDPFIELRRVLFVCNRDSRELALQWAKKTNQVYREAAAFRRWKYGKTDRYYVLYLEAAWSLRYILARGDLLVQTSLN